MYSYWRGIAMLLLFSKEIANAIGPCTKHKDFLNQVWSPGRLVGRPKSHYFDFVK